MQDATSTLHVEGESLTILCFAVRYTSAHPPLTVTDARRIIGCLRENRPRFHSLFVYRDDTATSPNPAVSNRIVRNRGLPSVCTTSITEVCFNTAELDNNDDLETLLPALYNGSVRRRLLRRGNNILPGQSRGGEVRRGMMARSPADTLSATLVPHRQ
jgi:hypothetical protein